MTVFGFWNNKGGTGKTSLAFQAMCRYAAWHPDENILAIDVCPQANLSELLLGGLTGEGSRNLISLHGLTPRKTIGGYFQLRLPSPFSIPAFDINSYIVTPSLYNRNIPKNIDLVAGDPLVELQSNAVSTLANTQVPGTNTWISVIEWVYNFIRQCDDRFDHIFIDANPSFSIYTQMAIAAIDLLVLPVMSDDSSRRAIQNAFSLIHGLRLPSPIYSQYAFATKLKEAERELPKVHIIAKNRLTQYMGPASAYSAVLRSIDNDVESLLAERPSMFSFPKAEDGMVDIRDFQTTGVVAFANGCPFFNLSVGEHRIMERRIRIKDENLVNCTDAIEKLVQKL